MDHKKEANLETKVPKGKAKMIMMENGDSEDRPISSNREREESSC